MYALTTKKFILNYECQLNIVHNLAITACTAAWACHQFSVHCSAMPSLESWDLNWMKVKHKKLQKNFASSSSIQSKKIFENFSTYRFVKSFTHMVFFVIFKQWHKDLDIEKAMTATLVFLHLFYKLN